MTTTDTDLHLILGRVEGKLDLVVSTQAAVAARLERNEHHHADLRDRVTVLETRRVSLREWVASVMSAIALAFAAFPHIRELFR